MDAYEGAIGIYFDVFKEMTAKEVEATFANAIRQRRVSLITSRMEDDRARRAREEWKENSKKNKGRAM